MTCGLTARGLLLAALAVLLPAGASAAVSADVATLPLRRPVLLPDGALGGRLWIVEDSALAAGAAEEFADLRLMDGTGAAVPLDRSGARRTDTIERPWRRWPLRWTEGDNGERWMTLDLGEAPPAELVLEAFGPSTGASFRVMGSADSAEWFVLPQNYDAWRPPMEGRKEAGFRTRVSEVRRYLRFAQDAGFPAPSPEDEVRLSERFESSTPRDAVGYRVAARFLPGSNDRYEILITLTGPPRAVTRVDLETPDPGRANFNYEVEARLPRGGWRFHAPDATPDWAGGSRDSLVFFPVRTTEIRVRVGGADAPNPPVQVVGVWAAPDRFGFTPAAGGSYWLGFGDPYLAAREAAAPVEPDRHDPAGLEAPRYARLGPVEPNPFHRAPGFGLDWLKRKPVVLSVAMVVILVVVALLARRPASR